MADRSEPLLAADDVAQITSIRSILSASAPAIANNAAAPIAAALQLGLIGHGADAANRVAVFSAVGAATTFVVNVANFVIVVTMARVGHALGAKDWTTLGRTVRATITVAALVGSGSALALWLGRVPLLAALSLSSEPALDKLATAYLPVAVGRIPPLLVLKAASSVLVGYQRVRVASALNGALACVDTLAFYVVLHALEGDLLALGAAVVATCACAAAIALCGVLLCRPHESVRLLGGDAAADGECSEPTTTTSASRGGSSLLSLACDSLNVLIRSVFLSGR